MNKREEYLEYQKQYYLNNIEKKRLTNFKYRQPKLQNKKCFKCLIEYSYKKGFLGKYENEYICFECIEKYKYTINERNVVINPLPFKSISHLDDLYYTNLINIINNIDITIPINKQIEILKNKTQNNNLKHKFK